jgi:recombinase-like zinc beta ribbon protein/recombinase
MNEVYRGRLIWNRSRWVRVPGTRRRRRVMRPESEWVVKERPDLRIIEEGLWQDVQARRVRVRARYDDTARFGKSRSEYGKYLLSGLLVCGTCEGSMSIRTSSTIKGQKYGCTRRWRRGPSVCANAILVRRDVAEANIARLLREKLYTRPRSTGWSKRSTPVCGLRPLRQLQSAAASLGPAACRSAARPASAVHFRGRYLWEGAIVAGPNRKGGASTPE